MNTVDQRILIPTPPDVVWEYISDITKNPQWQADCKSVTFLTSKRSGQGTRWRAGVNKGREQVIEVTAWYDGLGYQYTYIDGMPFREGTGRIRLQEIPEGTVVQWTIQYEVGGLLGGMRGSLGVTKQIEAMMVASLKTLWKQVNSSGAAQNWREAKSLMRDAPDAEARAHYKPRHTPAGDVLHEPEQQTPAHQPVIQEPPIAEDDTRPRPAVAAKPQPPAPPAESWGEETAEPDFLADLARFQPPAKDFANDTQPIKAITPEQERAGSVESKVEGDVRSDGANLISYPPTEQLGATAAVDDLLAELDAAIAEWPQESTPIDLEALGEPFSDLLVTESPAPTTNYEEPAQEIVSVEQPETPPAAALPDAPAPSAYEAVTQPLQPVTEPRISETIPEVEPQAIPGISEVTKGIPRIGASEAASMDTAQLSIWDVFGVQRPSETQELKAVKDGDTAELDVPVEAESPTPVPKVRGVVSVDLSRELLLPPQRVGLRMYLRRRSVNLRRPE